MNLTLTRYEYLSTGIFGTLEDEGEELLLYTLEHAYPYQPDGSVSAFLYGPKIPAGVYTCNRGLHRLSSMTSPFETFEVTNVPGHTNILIHPGNTEFDSSGCVLVGLSRQGDEVLQSKLAFGRLMDALQGINSFYLTIQ